MAECGRDMLHRPATMPTVIVIGLVRLLMRGVE
jgi:hypothetical protein